MRAFFCTYLMGDKRRENRLGADDAEKFSFFFFFKNFEFFVEDPKTTRDSRESIDCQRDNLVRVLELFFKAIISFNFFFYFPLDEKKNRH